MKTVTCTFSDEFVAAVIEVGRIFGEKADFGRIVEHYGGYALEMLATDPEHLVGDIEARTWDSEEECHEVAARALAKLDRPAGFRVIPSETEPGRWEIVFVMAAAVCEGA